MLCFKAVVPVKMPRRAALTLVAASSAKRVASYSRAWGLLWVKPYLIVSGHTRESEVMMENRESTRNTSVIF